MGCLIIQNHRSNLYFIRETVHFRIFQKERRSVMAREAACSSTHQPNGMRPLQAHHARSFLIGCELHRVNHPGAGAVQRRKEGRRRGREEGEKGPTSVRVPFPQNLLRSKRSTCHNQQNSGDGPRAIKYKA